jgi:hypothetical protein
VWWHTESDNLILLAVVLEFYQAVALIAVDNEQPICPSRGCLRISVEVLKPRYRDVVVNPASRRDRDNPVAR